MSARHTLVLLLCILFISACKESGQGQEKGGQNQQGQNNNKNNNNNANNKNQNNNNNNRNQNANANRGNNGNGIGNGNQQRNLASHGEQDRGQAALENGATAGILSQLNNLRAEFGEERVNAGLRAAAKSGSLDTLRAMAPSSELPTAFVSALGSGPSSTSTPRRALFSAPPVMSPPAPRSAAPTFEVVSGGHRAPEY